MESIVLRHSKGKRIFVTLIPALLFLCIYLLAVISNSFIEYGSEGYNNVEKIVDIFFLLMILDVPFIVKVHREKTVFDGRAFEVTPVLGKLRYIPVEKVGICAIYATGKVVLYDKDEKRICSYKATQDREKFVFHVLQRMNNCAFVFRLHGKDRLIVKGDDPAVEHYLMFGAMPYGENNWYRSKEPSYAKGEIDEEILKKTGSIRKRALLVQGIVLLCSVSAVVVLASGKGTFWAMCVFLGGTFAYVPIEYWSRKKIFEIIKATFYQVTATAVNEKDFAYKSTVSDRHVIYEFTDRKGVIRHRPSDAQRASNVVWGTDMGVKKTLWYSPYTDYLLETEALTYQWKRSEKRASVGMWLKHYLAWIIIFTAFAFVVGLQAYRFGKTQIFVYTHDGRNLQVEWNVTDEEREEQKEEALEASGMTQQELETWLKQACYPYFYANYNQDEFTTFDLREYKSSLDDEQVHKQKENLVNWWGISGRESLIEKMDSLLEKGDKYTYDRTLKQFKDGELDETEDVVKDAYLQEKPDEIERYMGAYYAYNEIGDAGIDAWDYCRYIRVLNCAYICGYITYDEYLIHTEPVVIYLQEEYDSWAQMYESYYYGRMVFLGRNKSEPDLQQYRYSHYEEMGEEAEIPFLTGRTKK